MPKEKLTGKSREVIAGQLTNYQKRGCIYEYMYIS